MSPGLRQAAATALALAVVLPPGGPWLGVDKLNHFMMSAFVQSASFSIARAAGQGRRGSNASAAAASAVAGVWKELHDKRTGRPFSIADLAWDAAGAGSMAALLYRTR